MLGLLSQQLVVLGFRLQYARRELFFGAVALRGRDEAVDGRCGIHGAGDADAQGG